MATMMKNERGIAMVAVLLVMLLMSALMVGFTAVIMSDQRFRGIDRDRSQAFYAAHSGLEKQTVDLHNLFFQNVAPTQGELNTLMAGCPDMTAQGVGFFAETDIGVPPTTCSGYKLRVEGVSNGQVQAGPYQGLIALKTRYNLDSTARSQSGGEVHLTRKVETVAIPVFQFGMFSDVDLSFFAGPQFNFGGRVHTNGNLFLSGGATLTLREKVTAVGEIVRQRLSNGASIDLAPAHNVDVSMARAAGSFRDLKRNEGSVVDGLGSALNGAWTNISLSTYNGYIRNGKTGAKPLNLPVITAGGSNPDLVRRPRINSAENTGEPDAVQPALLQPGQLAHPVVGQHLRSHRAARRDQHDGADRPQHRLVGSGEQTGRLRAHGDRFPSRAREDERQHYPRDERADGG